MTHLGHVLHHSLSDHLDITPKSRDMIRKANYLISTFHGVDPCILTHLFCAYCLSLYGASIWNLSCKSMHSLEVAFNNILRKIWHLPRNAHTDIVHATAQLQSLYNVVYSRSSSLAICAFRSPSSLVNSISYESSSLSYTFTGFNNLFGVRFCKVPCKQYLTCASVIRNLRLYSPLHSDADIELTIRVISSE